MLKSKPCQLESSHSREPAIFSLKNGFDDINLPQWSAWRAEDRTEDGIFASNSIKTVAEQIRRDQIQQRQQMKLSLEEQLRCIKIRPPNVIYPTPKQVPGISCKFCTINNEETQLKSTDRRKNLVNLLDCWKFQYSSMCPQLAHCLRLKQFEYRDFMATLPLTDATAENAIVSGKDNFNRSKAIFQSLSSMISDSFLVLSTWLLYKILPRFLTSVTIHPATIDNLKNAAKNNPGIPMIFLPLHRSSLDRLLITFVLKNNNVKIPLTLMNNSADLPILGAILRRQGVVFVQKYVNVEAGQKDRVYDAAVRQYIFEAMRNGHNLQFFLEGSEPSSTGKAKLPKLGLLSAVIDAYTEGVVKDVLLVPVSLNYEKLPDGGVVSKELGKRSASTLLNALRTCGRILRSNSGEARIDIHEPFSLNELVQIINTKYQEQREYPQHHYKRLIYSSTSSLLALDCPQSAHRLTKIVARHVMFNIINAVPVMSTNIVAYLLLTRFNNSTVTLELLAKELDKLREELVLKNIAFSGKSENVIMYAATLLGPEVIKVENQSDHTLITPVTKVPNVLGLRYYANSMITIYALEAVILTAANVLAGKYACYVNIANDLEVPECEMQETCLELSDILRYEFIFHKPCKTLENEVTEAIASLCDRGLLFKQVVEATEDEVRANRLAHFLQNDCLVDGDSDTESEDETKEIRDEYKKLKDSPTLQLPRSTQTERTILANMIKPIIFCYLTTAECLKNFFSRDCILEVEFVRICIEELKARVESGECQQAECISAETVRNALKLFEKWDVVEISTNYGIRVLTLTPLYCSKISIDTIVNYIQRYYL